MNIFEQQWALASEMARGFSSAASGLLDAQAGLWKDRTPGPGESWYRPPAPNLFDWSVWMPAQISPWTSTAPMMTAFMPMALANPFGLKFQPWSTLASFAGAMAVFEPAHNYWSTVATERSSEKEAHRMVWQAIMWPVSQLDKIAGAVVQAAETPAEFARHRSSGGHAAVAITLIPEPAVNGSELVH